MVHCKRRWQGSSRSSSMSIEPSDPAKKINPANSFQASAIKIKKSEEEPKSVKRPDIMKEGSERRRCSLTNASLNTSVQRHTIY